MKNLFDAAAVAEIQTRLAQLGPGSERVWGKMNAAQMMAHCSVGLQMALGDTRPKRMLIGRILGGFVKGRALANEDPLPRNSPTSKEFIVQDDRDLEAERARLRGLIERFSAGPQACTPHPHSFFGPMKPEEWAQLMYKHLDHHLRQFSS